MADKIRAQGAIAITPVLRLKVPTPPQQIISGLSMAIVVVEAGGPAGR
jgi:hypothetical protein